MVLQIKFEITWKIIKEENNLCIRNIAIQKILKNYMFCKLSKPEKFHIFHGIHSKKRYFPQGLNFWQKMAIYFEYVLSPEGLNNTRTKEHYFLHRLKCLGLGDKLHKFPYNFNTCLLTKCEKEAIKHVEHIWIPTTVLLVEERVNCIATQ